MSLSQHCQLSLPGVSSFGFLLWMVVFIPIYSLFIEFLLCGMPCASEMEKNPLVLPPYILCLPFVCRKTLAKE